MTVKVGLVRFNCACRFLLLFFANKYRAVALSIYYLCEQKQLPSEWLTGAVTILRMTTNVYGKKLFLQYL